MCVMHNSNSVITSNQKRRQGKRVCHVTVCLVTPVLKNKNKRDELFKPSEQELSQIKVPGSE